VGHVLHMGKMRSPCNIFIGKNYGKTPKRKWEDNIKMSLKKEG
jgi:hypothetical protein